MQESFRIGGGRLLYVVVVAVSGSGFTFSRPAGRYVRIGSAPRLTVSFIGSKKNGLRKLSDRFIVLALPIFPGRRQPSIVGAGELNCRVRNGNGWTLTAINTNYFYLNRSLCQNTFVL